MLNERFLDSQNVITAIRQIEITEWKRVEA